MEKLQPVRVRFAPSPTGAMHLGSGRTALYNYLLARQTGGQFILRIEDTDQKRFVPGAEQELIDGMHWMGIQWDEGPDIGGPHAPYRQSERKEIYQKYARQLVELGRAYYCFCTPQRLADLRQEQQSRNEATHYDGLCREIDPVEAQRRVDAGEPHVIRFKMPKTGTTSMVDELRGEIVVENSQLDDYILVKSDGLALYHLAAMVDDHEMGITHVIRGSEWLSTFPLHVQVIRAFGWQEPKWAHLSLFLKPSGKGKLSKRDAAEAAKDGHSTFIKDMRELGYTPEAVVNWIALMGWSYDDHTEFFLLDDLVKKFSLEKLNPAPAAVNFTKLDYFNGLHIRALVVDELARRVKPFLVAAGYTVPDDLLLKVAPLIQVRLGGLDEVVDMAGFFFREGVAPAREDLIAKGLTGAQSAEIAGRAYAILAGLDEISPTVAEPPMRALVEEMGYSAGQVFGILRVAVTGQKVSPPLFESMEVIGRKKVLERIQNAIRLLQE